MKTLFLLLTLVAAANPEPQTTCPTACPAGPRGPRGYRGLQGLPGITGVALSTLPANSLAFQLADGTYVPIVVVNQTVPTPPIAYSPIPGGATWYPLTPIPDAPGAFVLSVPTGPAGNPTKTPAIRR